MDSNSWSFLECFLYIEQYTDDWIAQRSGLFLVQVFVYFLILRNELGCDYAGRYESQEYGEMNLDTVMLVGMKAKSEDLLPEETDNI